ncbi:MAG TPA: hypothetical protein VNA14_11200 [Mycobacteriales bacterium]|nr:hypothetical protein [Mycobacteriales bacterium]
MTAQLLGAGPIPAGGELVQNIGLLTSTAEATDEPKATASARAAQVALLSQAGVPLLSAEAVRAVSTTTCTEDPSAAGTEFVNLTAFGMTGPIPTPAPNTELLPQMFNPLGIKVILNEQHPTADGRGLVVNAIHIYQFDPALVPSLFVGDIVVAHAMSTVNCPNGAGSTGGDNAVMIVKNVDTSTAMRGDTLTYTATVQNKSAATCPVNRFIDHLPGPFEFVSTSGDFGTVATTVARPGGGTDVILEPADLVIAAGGSATQTFVVKVKDDAAPGVYFNNVELFCGNLGNWVKGLDAPVEVVAAQTTPTTTTTEPPAELGLASTGGWGGGAVAGAVAAGLAALLFAVRRRLA